jgi:hypothetical protein
VPAANVAGREQPFPKEDEEPHFGTWLQNDSTELNDVGIG